MKKLLVALVALALLALNVSAAWATGAHGILSIAEALDGTTPITVGTSQFYPNLNGTTGGYLTPTNTPELTVIAGQLRNVSTDDFLFVGTPAGTPRYFVLLEPVGETSENTLIQIDTTGLYVSDVVKLVAYGITLSSGVYVQQFSLYFVSDGAGTTYTNYANEAIAKRGTSQYAEAFEPEGGGFLDISGHYDGSVLPIGINTDDAFQLLVSSEPVPLPPTALLLGSCLLGLVGFSWRRKNSS